MTATSLLLALSCTFSGAGVSGTVVDERGNPVESASVFLEAGLLSPLQHVLTGTDGTFAFSDVSPGQVGVFAVAGDRAFQGLSPELTVDEELEGLRLRLQEGGRVTVRIVGEDGDELAGARVTRVLISYPDNSVIGIPLTKMRAFGWPEPTTDGEGEVSIRHVPKTAEIALKIAHPDHAQRTATGLRAGTGTERIALSRGVLVNGRVVTQGEGNPVANASVLIRGVPEGDEPTSTIIARSSTDGTFGLRLEPGVYLYQARGTAYQSPGWQQMTVMPEQPLQSVTVLATGRGQLSGRVLDAKTGEPISGARLSLEAYGTPVAFTETGASGRYRFDAPEGDTRVRLNFIPGYRIPPTSSMRFRVEPNTAIDVPTFYAAPMPDYQLAVVTDEGEPVAGAVVTVLRPAQFGWRFTDTDGKVTLSFASLPADGVVVGFVEHPSEHLGAVFAIRQEDADNAMVSVLPLGRVSGRIVSASGAPVEGASVEARFSIPSIEDSPALWRTVSDGDGDFRWDSAPLYVPQLLVAGAVTPEGQIETASKSIIVNEDGRAEANELELAGDPEGESLAGKRLRWTRLELLCGDLPDRSAASTRPVALFYTVPSDAPFVVESVQAITDLPLAQGVTVVVVVEGEYTCDSSPVPVLGGERPGVATTYLLDPNGTVVHEGFGMPPVHALREAATPE